MNTQSNLTGWWHNPQHAVGVLLLDQGNGTIVGALTGYGNNARVFFLPFSGKLGTRLGLYHTKVAAWPPNGPYKGEKSTTEVGHVQIDVDGDSLNLAAGIQWWVGGGVRPSPPPPTTFEERFSIALTKLV